MMTTDQLKVYHEEIEQKLKAFLNSPLDCNQLLNCSRIVLNLDSLQRSIWRRESFDHRPDLRGQD